MKFGGSILQLGSWFPNKYRPFLKPAKIWSGLIHLEQMSAWCFIYSVFVAIHAWMCNTTAISNALHCLNTQQTFPTRKILNVLDKADVMHLFPQVRLWQKHNRGWDAVLYHMFTEDSVNNSFFFQIKRARYLVTQLFIYYIVDSARRISCQSSHRKAPTVSHVTLSVGEN